MTKDEPTQLTVIGAGTMGRGIAETAATHGLQVQIVEISQEQRQRAESALRSSLTKAVQRKKIPFASADEVLQNIAWATELPAASAAGFVVEAAFEDEPVKREILGQLDKLCPPETILASNTSSISITRLGAATGRPDRVVGMHFFNPVPVMSPVEIVRGLHTSDATLDATRRLAEQLGKQAFVVQDVPGFVVNRVLMPLINEAVFALQEGVADAATIDALMKLGCNHPLGPLQLADLIGLDVCLSILRVLHRELGDPKFRPCPLLVRMVDGGQLGRKSGTGFYPYETPAPAPTS